LIRLATSADVPRLVEMGQRFRRETTYSQHLAENPEQMEKLLEQLMSSDGVLVSEREGVLVGMIGYIVYSHFLSGDTVAGEVFWWVEPEARGDGLRLLREAERRAKERGARHLQMIAPTAQVAHVYERLGFTYVESTYQKTL
jgi:GNAT superfamily N-acetyltransferase